MSIADGVDTRIPTPQDKDLSTELIRLLIRALRLLGEAGAVDPACHLAAEGWQVTRRAEHAGERRFAGLLHYLADQPNRAGHTDHTEIDTKERRHDAHRRADSRRPPGDPGPSPRVDL